MISISNSKDLDSPDFLDHSTWDRIDGENENKAYGEYQVNVSSAVVYAWGFCNLQQ